MPNYNILLSQRMMVRLYSTISSLINRNKEELDVQFGCMFSVYLYIFSVYIFFECPSMLALIFLVSPIDL